MIIANIFSSIADNYMEWINSVNDFFWGYIIIILLTITAVWYTVKSGFVQFTMFKEMFSSIKNTSTPNATNKKREISSVEAFLISLASRVGVGNLAGVALAITVGGAGAIFWMWVMALLNAATAFGEAVLAQLYKSRQKDAYIGGPAYYILRGLKSKTGAKAIAILSIISFSITLCSIQSNTIAISLNEAFGVDPYVSAVLFGLLLIIVIFGGIHRIARVSSILVPVMAVAYIIVALFIVITNITEVPAVLSLIVKSAFGVEQIVGGGVGSIIMIGAKRGLLSNEAGMGSSPNAAATADVKHPVTQGLIQSLGVFVDTIIICSCTAFIILLSHSAAPEGTTGIALTQFALSNEIGEFAYPFIAIIVFFFGFSTCIANAYYGESNLMFLTKNRYLINTLRLLIILFVAAGAVVALELAWALADFFLIFIVFINLAAITILSNRVIPVLKDYKRQKREGCATPVFKKDSVPELKNDDIQCW